MNNFSYNTNTLLSLSRLPYHFWSGLNPSRDSRLNPGLSIVSYIVSKTLLLETTCLPKELNDNFKRIIDFNNQKDQICDFLKFRTKQLETILLDYQNHEKHWSLVANASLSIDKLKTKINETIIKISSLEVDDFSINDNLINLKIELEKLKMILNDEGIIFDWENK